MGSNLSRVPKKLQNFLVISRANSSKINNILISEGFNLVESSPDFIVCFGGDGTVLFSERKFPGVPKLIVKTSKICRKCDYTLNTLNNILLDIKESNYRLHTEMKLETEVKGKKLVGLNEIQIHLQLPIQAIRFSVSVNEKTYNNLVGDGIIVATPFGSTGYYEATGGERFEKGIGISFNNLHSKKIKSFVVPEDSLVRLTITRGPAWLLADNNENLIELTPKDTAIIKKAKGVANFIYVSQK